MSDPILRTVRTGPEIMGDVTGPHLDTLASPLPFHRFNRLIGKMESSVPPAIFEAGLRRAAIKLMQKMVAATNADEDQEHPAAPEKLEELRTEMIELFDRIGEKVPEGKRRAAYEKERDKVCAALQTGRMDQGETADLNEPERQLLWACSLAMAYADGTIKGEFSRHPLTEAVKKSTYVKAFVGDFCEHLMTQGHGNTTLQFGQPGSWFYWDPTRNRINMDLCFSLCMGGDLIPLDKQGKLFRCHGHFESIFYHEAGHARLSIFYPPSLTRRFERMLDLAEKGGLPIPPNMPNREARKKDYTPGEGVSMEEYKEYLRLNEEYRMLQRAWNAAEDNVVNEYMRAQSQLEDLNRRHPSQLGDAFNVASVIVNFAGDMVRDYAAGAPPKQPAGQPPKSQVLRAAIEQAGHAINMCFYIDNHFLPDTPQSWEALQVDFEKLRENLPPGERASTTAADVKKEFQLLGEAIRLAQPDADMGRANLARVSEKKEQRLREMAEALGIANFPAPAPRREISLRQQAQHFNTLRNAFIQHFFDRYVEPVMQELEPEIQQQIEQEIAQKIAEKQQQQGNQGQQGEQEQEGQEKEGACEGECNKGGGKGQGKSGKAGKRKGPGMRVKDLPPELEDEDAEAPALPNGAPQGDRDREQQSREGNEKGDEKGGEDGEEQSVGQIGRERQDNRGKEGDDQDGKKEADRYTPDKVQKMSGRMQIKAPAPHAPGGNSQSPFAGLNMSDGRSYAELKETQEFEEAVDRVADELSAASANARQVEDQISEDSYTFAPPPGHPVGQVYDASRARELQRKKLMGEAVHMQDFAHMHNELPTIFPTEGDIIILVDGSGSMGAGPGSPMEVAIKTAAILRHAGEKAGYRVYILLWGDESPEVVSRPGMDADVEAANIDAIINGKQCGTCLAPAFPAMLHELAEAPPSTDRAGRPQKHGYTHVFVVSDGGTFVGDDFGPMADALLQHMPMATVDAAITSVQYGHFFSDPSMCDQTPLEIELAKHTASHDQRASLSGPVTNSAEAPDQLLDLVRRRVEMCTPQPAMEEGLYKRQVEDARHAVGELDSLRMHHDLSAGPQTNVHTLTATKKSVEKEGV